MTIEINPDTERLVEEAIRSGRFHSVDELIAAGAAARLHADPRRKATALDWSQCPAVESVAEKVSGAWVLKGTRMPVSAIFENLEAGASIDEIMEWFDGLNREQVKAVIEFAARSLDRAPAQVP
jgi:uncharacterized protein (DUF433 family)